MRRLWVAARTARPALRSRPVEGSGMTTTDCTLKLMWTGGTWPVPVNNCPWAKGLLKGSNASSPSGRDRVDHRPGSHDDRANALAGLAEMLAGRKRRLGWSDLYPAE